MKYIIIAFLFVACNNINRFNSIPPISTEPLDTVQSTAGGIAATPILFETAFVKGTEQKKNNSIANLYGVTIGTLKVSSGRIIACDPMHIDEYGKPFTQVFLIGRLTKK